MRVGILDNPPVGEVLTPYANSRELASSQWAAARCSA